MATAASPTPSKYLAAAPDNSHNAIARDSSMPAHIKYQLRPSSAGVGRSGDRPNNNTKKVSAAYRERWPRQFTATAITHRNSKICQLTGIALALFAAVSGRWIDETMSRGMDALISIPSKIFALVLVAAFGSSVVLLLLVAAVTYIPGAYRIARSLAVNLNQMDYVQVARARGEGKAYIAVVEILPNMMGPMLADFGLRFVYVVLLLSGLSFLGLGVQPPDSDLGTPRTIPDDDTPGTNHSDRPASALPIAVAASTSLG